jgi:hypothetical protein
MRLVFFRAEGLLASLSLCACGGGAVGADSGETPITATMFTSTVFGDGAEVIQCLPQRPVVDSAGEAMCTVVIEVPADVQGHCSTTTCDPALGRTASPGSSTENGACAVCLLQQLTAGANPVAFQDGTCMLAAAPGWCFVAGAAAGPCPQAITFSLTALPAGTVASIACDE